MTPIPVVVTRNDAFPTMLISVGVGVFWAVWGVKGFWWALAYGAFWPVWLGYHLAHYLMLAP